MGSLPKIAGRSFGKRRHLKELLRDLASRARLRRSDLHWPGAGKRGWSKGQPLAGFTTYFWAQVALG